MTVTVTVTAPARPAAEGQGATSRFSLCSRAGGHAHSQIGVTEDPAGRMKPCYPALLPKLTLPYIHATMEGPPPPESAEAFK